MKTAWDYTELAAAYDRRGDYAPGAIDRLVELAELAPGDVVADIGAGTAKLTRPLLDRGLKVRAVEPNEAMRGYGIRNTEGRDVVWSEGVGEATGLDGDTFRLVTFGSSFNVTDRPATLKESARILTSRGWFACMWNHRDLEDACQRSIEDIIQSFVPEYAYGSRREDQTTVIERSPEFGPVEAFEERVVHSIPAAEFIEGWRSHATLQRQAGQAFTRVVEAIADRLAGLESLEVPYVTRVYCARRAM